MAHCSVCGEHDGLSHTCNYCGAKHCKKHQLPENHRCPGLATDNWRSYKQIREARKGKSRESAAASTSRSWGSSSPPVRTKSDDESENTPSAWESMRPPPPGARDDAMAKYLPGPAYAFFYAVGGLLTNILIVALALLTVCWIVVSSILSFVFSVRGLQVAIVLVLLVGLYSAVIGTGVEPIDRAVDDVIDTAAGAIPAANETQPSATEAPTTPDQSTPSDTPEGSTGSSGASSLNETQIEWAIHREVNDRRTEQGLTSLHFDHQLAAIAQRHSDDMVERGYFAHTSPDGQTMEDRYELHGYDCRVEAGGNQYLGGAENIAYTWAGSDVMMDSGGFVNHHFNETSIGQGIVRQWMNSEGHRENIMNRHWRNEGIGVAIETDGGDVRVYATQNFC